jgi:predicted DNA-binding protein YlxM (UPF0122 family)
MDEGMTLQEIADALGISRQAVDQLMRRAYIKIQKRLRERGVVCVDDLMLDEYISSSIVSDKISSD